jgi:hypothetical protein
MPLDFELDKHGLFQTAQTRLASWAGYLDRSGRYGSPGPNERSDGTVEIVFAPEGRDASPLDDNEMALAQWFLDHETDVSEAVKSAILQAYGELRESGDFSRDEVEELLPLLATPDDLRERIGLFAVNVHQIAKEGIPYLGFECGCTWDQEHGLGVLMHGTRVVAVGRADTAGLLWIAEQDAETG